MSYPNIDYLAWARQFMGRVRYDLAKSEVVALSKEDLGIQLSDIQLGAPHEGGCEELYDLIARRYGVGRENVFVCNGATQGIFLALSSILDPGDRLLVETPSYEPLSRVPQALGAEIRTVDRRPERGFQIDLEEVERRVSKTSRVLVMTNLHNPSGAATNADKMVTLGQILRDVQGHVVCSEVYLDAALGDDVRPAAACGPNLISLGSLSKVYGLSGVRAGWIVADEEVIGRVKTAADYISGGTSYPSQTVALFALRKGDKLIRRTTAITRANLERIREWIRERGDVSWFEPAGGTVALLRLPRGVEASALSNLLRERYSTLVVPGEFFSLRDTIRISCGVAEDVLLAGLKNLAAAIDDLLSSKR